MTQPLTPKFVDPRLIAADTERLGIDGPLSVSVVQAAFRARAKLWHPDVNADDPRSWQLAIEARDRLLALLGDEDKSAPEPPSQTIPRVDIALKMALEGGRMRVSRDGSLLDSTVDKGLMHEAFELHVPAGLREGETLWAKAESPRHADVNFEVRLITEAGTRVWGDDIWMTALVNRRLFYFGGVTDINAPSGPLSLEIKAGTHINSTVTLKGLGMPAFGTRATGDLVIRLEAAAALVRPAKELLRAFQSAYAA